MADKLIRLSFSISKKLQEKSKSIPWGLKASLLRILLERIVDAGEEHGKMVYGAILEGEYDITPRSKK